MKNIVIVKTYNERWDLFKSKKGLTLFIKWIEGNKDLKTKQEERIFRIIIGYDSAKKEYFLVWEYEKTKETNKQVFFEKYLKNKMKSFWFKSSLSEEEIVKDSINLDFDKTKEIYLTFEIKNYEYVNEILKLIRNYKKESPILIGKDEDLNGYNMSFFIKNKDGSVIRFFCKPSGVDSSYWGAYVLQHIPLIQLEQGYQARRWISWTPNESIGLSFYDFKFSNFTKETIYDFLEKNNLLNLQKEYSFKEPFKLIRDWSETKEWYIAKVINNHKEFNFVNEDYLLLFPKENFSSVEDFSEGISIVWRVSSEHGPWYSYAKTDWTFLFSGGIFKSCTPFDCGRGCITSFHNESVEVEVWNYGTGEFLDEEDDF